MTRSRKVSFMSGSLRQSRIISVAVNRRAWSQTRLLKSVLRCWLELHPEDIHRSGSMRSNSNSTDHVAGNLRGNGKYPQRLHPIWKIGLLVTSSIAIGSLRMGAQAMPDRSHPAILESMAQTPGSSTLDRPVLELGSQGTAVSELQAALKLLGYYSGAVSGTFDRATADAVSGFQQAAGLTPNGIVDAKTWTRLFPARLPEAAIESCSCDSGRSSEETTAAGDLPLLRLGMRGTAVLGVQQRLQAIGFFQGKVDGVFGTDTQAAVEAVQESYDLQADGIVGPDTWEVLMR